MEKLQISSAGSHQSKRVSPRRILDFGLDKALYINVDANKEGYVKIVHSKNAHPTTMEVFSDMSDVE